MLKEITLQELNPAQFITEKVAEIKTLVSNGNAINALSGDVDSSVVTMIGHQALGAQVRIVFIENGLMRQGESAQVVALFGKFGVKVEVIDARK